MMWSFLTVKAEEDFIAEEMLILIAGLKYCLSKYRSIILFLLRNQMHLNLTPPDK